MLFGSLNASSQNKTFTTHLPIFYLNTSGQTIVDEPKIDARLEIAWKGEGEDNSTSDPHDHFSGNIGIEIRGSSSQMFPKKSYGFELRDDQGEDMDFPLLGLPEEEDWILYAPYSDKSLMRNVLIFTLANQISDTYASRCRFVELFLNNEYMGVYVLMEKIKRDKYRVDISKLNDDEIDGEDLTGGYIVKIDKQTGSGGDGWSSAYANDNNSRTFYQYEYPKSDEIVAQQKSYIQNYIYDFETAVYNRSHSPENGYQNYMNLETFYDYVILNEISKNVDGYRLSTFLNKDKNGKLNAGPIWDYNLAFGNADYYEGWITYGLMVYQDLGSDYWQIPFWWKELVSDSEFADPMRCRWDDLKENYLSSDNVMGIIDSLRNNLGEAVNRNFHRWPILTQYVWPNYYVGNTYSNEIDWMKNWINNRLERVDFELPGTCDLPSVVSDLEDYNAAEFYPNPFRSELSLKINIGKTAECNLDIYGLNGSIVSQQVFSVTEGENRFTLRFPELPGEVYLYRITENGNPVSSGKLVKH